MRVVPAALQKGHVEVRVLGERRPKRLRQSRLVCADARAAGRALGAVGRQLEAQRPGVSNSEDARRVRLVQRRGELGRTRGAGGDGGDAGRERLRERLAERGACGARDRLVLLVRAAGVHARHGGDAVSGDDDGDAELRVRGELVDHVVEERQAGGDLASRAEVHHRGGGFGRANLRRAGALGPRKRGRRGGGVRGGAGGKRARRTAARGGPADAGNAAG